MEFYFGDTLRWSCGFENPNKAAAFFATLLPLLWMGAALAWRLRPRRLRAAAVLAGTAAVLAGCWLLFQTLSRGGIAAALCGFAYVGWRTVGVRKYAPGRPQLVWCAALLLSAGALFVSSRAAERGWQAVRTEDKSVSNRWPLWKGGLKMAAENPRGVGCGNSGEMYVQWYQPVDATARYRTLVNSYLTFLAEQGFAVFGGAVFAALSFWLLTQRAADRRDSSPGRVAELSAEEKPDAAPAFHTIETGLRASLIAFCAAGLWSTTMEEPKLWALPALAAAGLAGIAPARKRRWSWAGSLQRAAGLTLLLCAALYLGGAWLTRGAPLRVAVRSAESVDLAPSGKVAARAAVVLVDEQVLGRDYGRLLRRLASGAAMRVSMRRGAAADVPPSPGLLLVATGETAARVAPAGSQAVALIAPGTMEEGAARRLAAGAGALTLLLSDYDEDGRAALWQRIARESPGKAVAIPLEGVGTQVEWAWEQVLAALKGA